ncbi:hypothetical protein [Williamsia serinedens]|uniref:Type VII secretion protein EccE n=1 Tax=Williamsia serinedens TaxID=391736 RepID=A0ABT1H2K2_9NOCA|nr:hypothetical protein [Williamsia serinedens]MCP2161475.1 hypothetical protein [Williamsia serinedens]
MSRTPHPDVVSLLRADGMASALLVTLSWWSAILLASHVSPSAVLVTVAVAAGVTALGHSPTRAAMAVRFRVLVYRPAPTPPRPRPVGTAPPPPAIALRAVETVRRTRAPGAAPATV